MPLIRCSSQRRQTLIEHYSELLTQPESEAIGQVMLEFIHQVNRALPKANLWGLTSIYHLILLREDDYRSKPYIVVVGRSNSISLEYLMPSQMAPWPNAYVRGEATSQEDAIQYLKIAMVKSGGWTTEEVM